MYQMAAKRMQRAEMNPDEYPEAYDERFSL